MGGKSKWFRRWFNKVYTALAVIYFSFYLFNFFHLGRFCLTEEYKKKNFRFEHYGLNVKQVEKVLYELHPIGSDVLDFMGTMTGAGAIYLPTITRELAEIEERNPERTLVKSYQYPTGFWGITGWKVMVKNDDQGKIIKIVVWRRPPFDL